MSFRPWSPQPNNHALRGTTLFKAYFDGGAAAFDAATGHALWEKMGVEPPHPPLAPRGRYDFGVTLEPTSRRIWVDADSDRIVTLARDGPGLCAVGRDAAGHQLWTHDFPAPTSIPTRESVDVGDDRAGEDCEAFFAVTASKPLIGKWFERRDSDTVYLGCMQWPSRSPKLTPRLELTALDPESGTTAWERALPDVKIPIMELRSFTEYCISNHRILFIDPASGQDHTLLHHPTAGIMWPCVAGPHVLLIWHDRGTLTIEAVDRATHKRVSTATLKCPKPKDVDAIVTPNRVLLNINASGYVLLSPDFKPLKHVKVRGYCDRVRDIGDNVEIDTRYFSVILDGRTGEVHSQTPKKRA